MSELDSLRAELKNLEAQLVVAKTSSEGGKIQINGSFGKLGSKWSKLYSPHLMIQTTVTGQLALLMFIECMEVNGFRVLSANTDGVTVKCPRARRDEMATLVEMWEEKTGFTTEETEYLSVHSRDVNSYCAIKPDGKLKLKGAFAVEHLCPSPSLGLQKNPTNEVCVEAAIAFLRDGAPISQTIMTCADIRKFVTIRQVNGGAVDQQGGYLGKAVRWYYAKGAEGPLRYKLNGYTVARSEGARALMQLPDAVPEDLDRDWYVREALSILADVGVDPVAYAVRDLV
jgi:hypothetical protein